MQRKNLASKIVSILLSAAMIVSTPMTTLATDGDVQVAEQAEVQIASDVVDDTDADAALAESSLPWIRRASSPRPRRQVVPSLPLLCQAA